MLDKFELFQNAFSSKYSNYRLMELLPVKGKKFHTLKSVFMKDDNTEKDFMELNFYTHSPIIEKIIVKNQCYLPESKKLLNLDKLSRTDIRYTESSLNAISSDSLFNKMFKITAKIQPHMHYMFSNIHNKYQISDGSNYFNQLNLYYKINKSHIHTCYYYKNYFAIDKAYNIKPLPIIILRHKNCKLHIAIDLFNKRQHVISDKFIYNQNDNHCLYFEDIFDNSTPYTVQHLHDFLNQVIDFNFELTNEDYFKLFQSMPVTAVDKKIELLEMCSI